ncbi:hypothetical protein [Streptomyces goshikiensis]|uniref:hypothetical protein n=1 Tax=Streptomyces goshikiensis TaxID=1942 RepID=UPI0036D14BE1
MTTAALYEIETSEGDDGTMHPVEQLWTPCADDAAGSGFIAHHGLYVAAIDDATEGHLCPVAFLVLGHQRWADMIEATAAYMARVHGWRNLHLYTGDDPSVLIPPHPARRPHPGRLLTARPPGTRLRMGVGRHLAPPLLPTDRAGRRPDHRHAASGRQVAVAAIPSPDNGSVPVTWAL